MSTFSLTNKAIADLKDIGRYTLERWGREQRNLYLGMLDATFQQLASNPLTGKDCKDIRNGYRAMGTFLIFIISSQAAPVSPAPPEKQLPLFSRREILQQGYRQAQPRHLFPSNPTP